MKRVPIALIALALVTASTSALGWRWVSDPGRPSGRPVDVEIERGTSGAAIASQLERMGVIDSALAFRVYMKVKDLPGVQAGRYRLRTGMSHEAVTAALAKGPSVEFVKLVIPEGSNLDQVAAQVARLTHIEAADFIAAATAATVRPSILPPGIDTLEGFLYPATYYVEETETAQSLVKRLVAEFEEKASDVGLERASAMGRTPYEILIVASMIEEEAKTKPEDPSDERTKMSSVIHNRLKKGIPLGIDATIQYAVKKFQGQPLTQSDLEIDSPFNTRRRQGLPPTPISSPRAASIAAALEPAQTDLLYYVLSSDCVHHVFTASYDAFLKAKASQPTRC